LASLARPAQPFSSPPAVNPSLFARLTAWLDLRRFFAIAIFITMLIAAIQPVTDPDFWWHLTTGNWILANHAIPRHDLYTFTVSGHRWITHEWLSEIVFAVLYAIGRLPLVSIALGAVTAAGFLLVYRSIDRRVGFVIRALILVLGVAAANPIWGPRIQMITFALSALTYFWVQRFCEGRSRALYALPLVMLAWVNLHAGFVFAYAIVGVALAVEGARFLIRRPDALPLDRLRALLYVLIASVAVAIVNPNGWDIYLYPFQTGGSAEQQKLIVEWFSPNFQMPQMWAFEVMIFMIIGTLALARRIELRQFLLMLIALGMSLHSVRNLSFFMLAAVPPLADYAQQAVDRVPWRRRFRTLKPSPLTFAINVVLLLLLSVVVTIASAPSLLQRVDGKLVARDFPIQAADFLVKHPAPGHMLNVYGWGGYLIFRLHGETPAQPVFIFGDAALDGDQLLKDYSDLQSLAPDQRALLDRYQINWVIFHSDDPIITELRQVHGSPGDPGWFQLGTFGKATIMMRDTAQNRQYKADAGL
jgi:hypothetical protein